MQYKVEIENMRLVEHVAEPISQQHYLDPNARKRAIEHPTSYPILASDLSYWQHLDGKIVGEGEFEVKRRFATLDRRFEELVAVPIYSDEREETQIIQHALDSVKPYTKPITEDDKVFQIKFFKEYNAAQRLAAFKGVGILPDYFKGKLNHTQEFILLGKVRKELRIQELKNILGYSESTTIYSIPIQPKERIMETTWIVRLNNGSVLECGAIKADGYTVWLYHKGELDYQPFNSYRIEYIHSITYKINLV